MCPKSPCYRHTYFDAFTFTQALNKYKFLRDSHTHNTQIYAIKITTIEITHGYLPCITIYYPCSLTHALIPHPNNIHNTCNITSTLKADATLQPIRGNPFSYTQHTILQQSILRGNNIHANNNPNTKFITTNHFLTYLNIKV